ncbi:hypothetical protein J4233_02525 [Candidatus Pacearchaeota archaeon]|nr:hypothetical protein [Candidatus Pacearchaeota archaeon]
MNKTLKTQSGSERAPRLIDDMFHGGTEGHIYIVPGRAVAHECTSSRVTGGLPGRPYKIANYSGIGRSIHIHVKFLDKVLPGSKPFDLATRMNDYRATEEELEKFGLTED